MKILFENKKKTITLKSIMWSVFIKVPIYCTLFLLLFSLFTWSKPNLNEIIKSFFILAIIYVYRLTLFIFKSHLESITLNHKEKKLIIRRLKAFKSPTKTVFKLNEFKISEIKYFPFKSFAFYNYFIIEDKYSKVKLSTSGHKNKEINLQDIYKELHTLTSK